MQYDEPATSLGPPSPGYSSIEGAQARTSLACHLPYHVLFDIFVNAAQSDPDEGTHGGKLKTWDSFSSARSMALVCSAWLPAATAVLYRSVYLSGGDRARKFDRTLKREPARAQIVRYLVISVGDEREESEDSTGLERDSHDLVRMFALCSNVEHVHIRPLHRGVRSTLLTALRSKQLKSLICAPRLYLSVQAWGNGLWTADDIELFQPSAETIELDFVTLDQDDRVAAPARTHKPTPPQHSLKRLRLHCDLSDDTIWQTFAAATQLRICDVYFERSLAIPETVAALSASLSTMQEMRFVCNPTTEQLDNLDENAKPVFDFLLPFYTELKVLTVSATEISYGLFNVGLPPKLETIVVQSFNHKGSFVYSDSMVDALHSGADVGALKTLVVYDEAQAWEEDMVEKLDGACRSRGIQFRFFPDEAEMSDE